MVNKIFGIGLSRTGTTSLTKALGFLGYKIIHAPRPHFLPGLYDVIKEVDGATDLPIAFQYKELDKLFPNSKFILTTRSLESWLRSCWEYPILYKRGKRIPKSNLYKRGKRIPKSNLGVLMYGRNFNFKRTYFRHHKQVMEYFKDRDLLIMNLPEGDGWDKLCSFLGKEIPNIPFPHLNTITEALLRSKKRNERIQRRRNRG